jgi:zinc transporter ZupT
MYYVQYVPGDVAILLHSGLSMKRALLLNFLSACVAFMGLVVGIVLGESTTATRWVLAIAAGLFLYVPLCDMVGHMGGGGGLGWGEGGGGVMIVMMVEVVVMIMVMVVMIMMTMISKMTTMMMWMMIMTTTNMMTSTMMMI